MIQPKWPPKTQTISQMKADVQGNQLIEFFLKISFQGGEEIIPSGPQSLTFLSASTLDLWPLKSLYPCLGTKQSLCFFVCKIRYLAWLDTQMPFILQLPHYHYYYFSCNENDFLFSFFFFARVKSKTLTYICSGQYSCDVGSLYGNS